MNKLSNCILLPTRTIHKDEEIVDNAGDLLLIASDKSVNTKAISTALNNHDALLDLVKDLLSDLEYAHTTSEQYYKYKNVSERIINYRDELRKLS